MSATVLELLEFVESVGVEVVLKSPESMNEKCTRYFRRSGRIEVCAELCPGSGRLALLRQLEKISEDLGLSAP